MVIFAMMSIIASLQTHDVRPMYNIIVPTVGPIRGACALVDGMHRETRIAVVGSSGNLLERRFGPAIDEHDMVMRVNAPDIAARNR